MFFSTYSKLGDNMRFIEYDRKTAVKYARKWAYKRNGKYYNFDSVGGDCTNFVSQCLYAGSKVMNYKKDLGWYYINGNNKSPSWTGVEFLFDFLVNNKEEGPFGKKVNQEIEIPKNAKKFLMQKNYNSKMKSNNIINYFYNCN